MHSLVFTFSQSTTNVISKRCSVFMWHVKLISLTWCVAHKWRKRERNESKIFQVNVCANEHMFVECCTYLGAIFFSFIFYPFYKVSTWDCVSPFLWAVFTVWCFHCTNCMDVWREPYSYFASLALLFLLLFAQFILYLHTNEVVRMYGSRIVSVVPLSHSFCSFIFLLYFYFSTLFKTIFRVLYGWHDREQNNICTLYNVHIPSEAYLSILYEIFSALWTAVFYILFFFLFIGQSWMLDEWNEQTIRYIVQNTDWK